MSPHREHHSDYRDDAFPELSEVPPVLELSPPPNPASTRDSTQTPLNVQEWESKILDRVSRMAISSTPVWMPQDQAAEVSFTADDLETPPPKDSGILSPSLVSSPVRKRRNTVLSSPLTPIRPCESTTTLTPQVSNLHPRRTKKAKWLSSSSPLPLYLRQPYFSPCVASVAYDARLDKKQGVVIQNEQDQDTLALSHSLNNSAALSPILPCDISWIHPVPPNERNKRRPRRRRLLRMRNDTKKSCAPFPFFPLHAMEMAPTTSVSES